MPPPNERAGNICVYLVSFLLFLAIVTGGAFLVLYMTLPESEDTILFPIVGLALVGMPWIFWTTTCLYRTVSARQPAGNGGADRAPGRASAPAAVAAVDEDPPADSPGGRGKVRFGAATVMDGSQEASGGGGGDGGGGGGGRSPDEANGEAGAADGDSHAIHRSSSSLTSHESEVPLFPMS